MGNPVIPIYVVELSVLLTALIVVLILPLKLHGTNAENGWRLHLPNVPAANHHHLLFGISIFGPGITATSFVLALGPSRLSHLIGVSSPLITGSMACAMFLAATILSMTGIALSLISSSIAALIVATLLAGTGLTCNFQDINAVRDVDMEFVFV